MNLWAYHLDSGRWLPYANIDTIAYVATASVPSTYEGEVKSFEFPFKNLVGSAQMIATVTTGVDAEPDSVSHALPKYCPVKRSCIVLTGSDGLQYSLARDAIAFGAVCNVNPFSTAAATHWAYNEIAGIWMPWELDVTTAFVLADEEVHEGDRIVYDHPIGNINPGGNAYVKDASNVDVAGDTFSRTVPRAYPVKRSTLEMKAAGNAMVFRVYRDQAAGGTLQNYSPYA